MDNQIIWLLAGALLIIGEFFIVPGVGMLFAGFGALITGLLVELGVINDPITEWIVFFVATIASAAILWKTLKNFRQNKSGKQFKDMVGDKVVLETAIKPGEEGKVKWSGTVMRAKLDDSVKKGASKGESLEIVRVEGNLLVIK